MAESETRSRLDIDDSSDNDSSPRRLMNGDGGAMAKIERPAKDVISIVESASIAGMSCVEAGVVESEVLVMASHTLSQATAAMQGDAPACDVCGAITVRNGTCYKCLNCGNSMGCS
jgi:ribonucleoside-diphosphate reductase alpha chain